jgi:hypothetical protein
LETEGTAQRLTDNQEYLPVHQGPLPRTFEELATPQHALYASEHLSQKESSRCSTGVVYLPRPFEGAPEGIREKNPQFSHLRDQNQHQSSQNNANAVFCLAS